MGHILNWNNHFHNSPNLFNNGALLDKLDKVYRNSGCKQKAIVAVARKLMMKIHAITIKEDGYEINKAA